jgi:Xaa-Pro aminopeptidase
MDDLSNQFYKAYNNALKAKVGLELDEFLVFTKRLSHKFKTGMTFSLKPKFVIPNGEVGIENTFVLRDSSVEKLTLYDENVIRLQMKILKLLIILFDNSSKIWFYSQYLDKCNQKF